MSRCELKVLGPWILCLAAVACVGDKEGEGLSASSGPVTSATTGDVESTGDADTMTPVQPTSGGTSSASQGSGDPTTGDPTAGGTSTTGDPVTPGCGKVDLLFVIDSSSTMGAEQQQFVAAFPAFYDALAQTLGDVDYHIMAVSADDSQSFGLNQSCNKMGDCTCGPAPTCCKTACTSKKTLTCNTYACTDFAFDECTFKYGTGRNFGIDGGSCGLESGARYMLGSQTDVPAAFACVAGVGAYDTFGDKKPMLAAVEATGAVQNDVGGCNEGFVRDDALLVVVFISDKDDDNVKGALGGSPGTPQEWHDAILAAKKGNAESIAVLGLVGDGNLPGGTCDVVGEPSPDGLGAAPAPRLQQFVGLFAHGAVGSVCAADYAPFLTDSVATIGQACAAFGQ